MQYQAFTAITNSLQKKFKSVARNKRAVRQNWRLSLYGTTHTADIISEKILSRNKLFAGHILVTYYHN